MFALVAVSQLQCDINDRGAILRERGYGMCDLHHA